MAGGLLRRHRPQAPQKQEYHLWYILYYLVLTAAAQLGVKYPPNLNIVHKTINAYDIPTYKMTPHF